MPAIDLHLTLPRRLRLSQLGPLEFQASLRRIAADGGPLLRPGNSFLQNPPPLGGVPLGFAFLLFPGFPFGLVNHLPFALTTASRHGFAPGFAVLPGGLPGTPTYLRRQARDTQPRRPFAPRSPGHGMQPMTPGPALPERRRSPRAGWSCRRRIADAAIQAASRPPRPSPLPTLPTRRQDRRARAQRSRFSGVSSIQRSTS